MKITYGKCVLALVIDHVGFTWACRFKTSVEAGGIFSRIVITVPVPSQN